MTKELQDLDSDLAMSVNSLGQGSHFSVSVNLLLCKMEAGRKETK